MRRKSAGTQSTILVALALVLTSCGGADGSRPQPDAGVRDAAPARKRIFATSTRHNGDLKTAGGGATGLEGADNLCRTAATGGGLGGSWKAWLSDSSTNAIDRIADVGPWYALDGKLVFNNKAGLATTPVNAIRVDQNGNAWGGEVWTGTSVGGSKSGSCCLDWTSTDSAGVDATIGSSGYNWTDTAWTRICSNKCFLYCIEQ
jgi:hypothetical protein